MAGSRGRRVSLWLLAVTIGAAGLLPVTQAGGKGLAVFAEAVGIDVPRPFAPAIVRRDVALDGVTGHLYAPDEAVPPIMLLPGAAPLGKDDPRAVRLARSLARAGRAVFIPDLTLYERRLVPEDIERIIRAAVALEAHPLADGDVTLLGVSYGGSFALVAAADDRLRGVVGQVATFGAYWDLVGVIQAVTTDVSLVHGARIPWEGHPDAREILEEAVTGLVSDEIRPPLRAALASGDPSGLGSEARAVYDLLRNTEPQRTRELATRLPSELRAVLAGFSPSAVSGRLDVPIIAMHSTDDPAVPYAELLRLRRAVPASSGVTVSSFRHVDLSTPTSGGWLVVLGDAWRTWWFTARVLAAQE